MGNAVFNPALHRAPWVRVPPPPFLDTRGLLDHFEVYATPTTHAMLRLQDSWPGIDEAEIQQRLSDGDSWWFAQVYDPVARRWYDVVEKGSIEDLAHFGTRRAALDMASIIETDIADARISGRPVPDWAHEDLPAYLRWFQAQVPNRVDYVRLLQANDPNGSYHGLLLEPVRVAEEVFEEVFEDLRAADNPVAAIPGLKAELIG